MPKDAAWYEDQINQLKRELDALNPAHDTLKAQHGEATANLQLAQQARDGAVKQLADLQDKHEGLSLAHVNLNAQASEIQKALDLANQDNADLRAKVERMRGLLAPFGKLALDLHQAVAQVMQAGE